MTVQYFEDLAVGQKFASANLRVDAEAIKAFAAEFDPQPFHLDDEAARASLFGGLAASGWHTAALTMRLCVTSDFRPAGGIIGVGGELIWLKPVRPGDSLHVEVEIVETRAVALAPGPRGHQVPDDDAQPARRNRSRRFTPTLFVDRRPG